MVLSGCFAYMMVIIFHILGRGLFYTFFLFFSDLTSNLKSDFINYEEIDRFCDDVSGNILTTHQSRKYF